MSNWNQTSTVRKSVGGRFPTQLVNRGTREVFDLEIVAPCPRCGYELVDPRHLENLPTPGAWYAMTSAHCEHCDCVYQVRMIEEPAVGAA